MKPSPPASLPQAGAAPPRISIGAAACYHWLAAMSRSAPLPVPVASWRHRLASLVTVLTLTLLAGGLMVPHGTAEEHSDLPVGTRLDANARHPDQPLHMETADPEVVHACTACLLQTSTRSTLGRPAAVPRPFTTGNRIAPEAQPGDDAPVQRLAPARAPPAALPCR